jgi:hypothetical protein
VLHISAPITPFHRFNSTYSSRWEISKKGIHDYAEGLLNWVPLSLVPWQISRNFLKIRNFYSGSILRFGKHISKAGMSNPDVLMIDEPRFVGLESTIKAAHTIYRPTDIYWSMKNDTSIIEAEKLLLAKVSRVAATSQPVLDHIKSLKSNIEGQIFENGFNLKIVDSKKIERGAVVRGIYYGSLDDRFDFELVKAIAEKNPKVQFDIYSPDIESTSSGPRGNVSLNPAIPYEELPEVMSKYQFGFLPFSDSISNNGRSPMKLFEMIARGLPVFVTKTSELSRRNIPFLVTLDDKTEIMLELENLDSELYSYEQRTRFISQYTWENIAERLVQFACGTSRYRCDIKL